MKKISFLVLSLLMLFSACNQQPENYNQLIAEARDLYEAGEYEDSGKKYAEAFSASEENDSISHHYEAAKAWAMGNRKDAAFEQLSVLTNEGEYRDLLQISSDNDFNNLRSDERWMYVLTKVGENKKAAEAHLKEVASLLETVRYNDQKYRQELAEIQQKHGHDSKEVMAHWELIHEQDSINLIKVEQVLKQHGWLGWDLIGRSANGALFLVIQHADLETQKKYLPMLREAVKRGDASPADMALLEDRVALRQGKKQIYGSQIGRDQETGKYYVSPLQDPDNVNERRAEVGLPPIEEYISNWGLDWDEEVYKMNLPELEAKELN